MIVIHGFCLKYMYLNNMALVLMFNLFYPFTTVKIIVFITVSQQSFNCMTGDI